LRFTDEQLRDVLTYGRPFSPMPAWGLDGGGPMNAQQIDNLIAYLHKIQIDPKDAKEASTKDALTERIRLAGRDKELAALQKRLGDAKSDSEKANIQDDIDALYADVEADDATLGPALFNMNCARCHTLGWSYDEPSAPGSGAYGPPLYNATGQFPDIEDQIDFVSAGRKRGERYGVNGQASGRMPHFGKLLTADQIEAIVEYERSLGESR
jgi:mono/diheme cytochrome c family protein